MAFPTNDLTPSDAARAILGHARALRSDAQKYIDQCNAGSLNVHDVAAAFCANHLARVKVQWAALDDVPGVFEELARQKPNQFANAAAAQTAFNAAATAINNMILYIEANIPMDNPATTRRILSLILSNDGSGTLTQRTITAGASLNAFKAQLETFRDAFDTN
jgi:hypothetical protein